MPSRARSERVKRAEAARDRVIGDPEYQRLTELAAAELGVKRTQINIVTDRVVQAAGIEEFAGTDVSLEDSLCATVVRSDEALSTPDASEDPRFASVPGVAAGIVRAYCGAPIRWGADGLIVGVFCAHEADARSWTPGELRVLQSYADKVSAALGPEPQE